MSHRSSRALTGGRLLLLSLLLIAAACTGGGDLTRCDDGSHVQGECHLAPDGTYFGDGTRVAEDVADDTADEADEEADEQSGLSEVEVVEIEIGSD